MWLGLQIDGVAIPGLSNQALKFFFIALAVIVFLWGFERYRTRFSRLEFLLAILFSAGIITVGVIPDFYRNIGAVLNLEKRSLVISVLANSAFIILILYLSALIRNNQMSINELTRSLTIDQAGVDHPVDGPSIYVIIPAYNESESITDVIEGIPETILGYSVTPLVVSDGSRDDTAARAERSGTIVVEHPINQGQGGALKTGFEIARRKGAEIVVTMDADGQHPPDQLEDLVAPIVNDEADYVVGSRYLGVDNSNNPASRNIGIRVFTFLINLLTKADVTDSTNGFRAIRGTSLDQMTLTEERFSAPELIIEARKNGLRITEVPVTIRYREAGDSKKPHLGYAFGLARTILTTWFR